MAVIVKATAKDAKANSYATVVEADNFFDTVYGASEWAGLSVEDKGRLLISATRMLDELPMKYDPFTTTQALKFPVADADGAEAGFAAVKNACLYQALFLFENADALKEAQTGAIQGVKSESLSSISKTVTGFNIFARYSKAAIRSLSGYLDFDLTTCKHPTLGDGTRSVHQTYTGRLGRLWP